MIVLTGASGGIGLEILEKLSTLDDVLALHNASNPKNMNLKNVKHLTEKKRVLFCSVKLVLFFSSSFRLFNKSLYSNPHNLNYMFLMPAQLPS